jgi:tetrahydromethanopterin S-methyltransferase subunit F
MANTQNGATLQRLVREVARNAADLVQRELALFRGELKSGISGLAVAIITALAAIAFVITGLTLLAGALVEYLTPVLESRALADLLVGIGALAIAAILLLVARHRMSLDQMAPKRSLRALERDRDVLARRAHG